MNPCSLAQVQSRLTRCSKEWNRTNPGVSPNSVYDSAAAGVLRENCISRDMTSASSPYQCTNPTPRFPPALITIITPNGSRVLSVCLTDIITASSFQLTIPTFHAKFLAGRLAVQFCKRRSTHPDMTNTDTAKTSSEGNQDRVVKRSSNACVLCTLGSSEAALLPFGMLLNSLSW